MQQFYLEDIIEITGTLIEVSVRVIGLCGVVMHCTHAMPRHIRSHRLLLILTINITPLPAHRWNNKHYPPPCSSVE